MKKIGTFLILITFLACSPSEEELFQEGIARLETQKFTEAVEYFDRTISMNPENTSAYNAKGVAFFELGEWDNAIEAFNASIALDSTSYKPFFNRGNAYLEKKEFTKAVIDYNFANGLDPQQTDIYYNRGLALLGMESYEDAILILTWRFGPTPINHRYILIKPRHNWETITPWEPWSRLPIRSIWTQETRQHFIFWESRN